MAENDPKQQQKDEFQVLQSIYEGQIEDLRLLSAWNVWRPLDFVICLYPAKTGVSFEEKSEQVSLNLHVKCSEKYPVEVPSLSIVSSKGLSNVEVKTLLEKLSNLTTSLKTDGQVMLMEICQMVQDFLFQKSTQPKSQLFKSFHEGMLKNQQKQELILIDAKRKLDEAEHEKRLLESAQIEKELEKRMHEKRMDILSKKRQQQQTSESELVGADVETDVDLRSRSSSVPPQKLNGLFEKRRLSKDETSKNFTCSKLKLTFNSAEKNFLRISALPAFSSYNVNYICLDEANSQLASISEWNLRWIKKCPNPNLLQKEIQTIEKEFQGLVKLDHSRLLRYLSFSVRHASNDSFSTIYVFKTFPRVDCFPVSFMLDRKTAASLFYIRSMCVDVLAALDFLHSKGVVHKDIRLDCIFDCSSSFMLADFSIRKRIADLVQTFKNDIRAETSLEINEPVSYVGMGKIGQKADVFMVGVCCLALASGADLPANAAVKVPDGLPSEFRSFVQRMISRDEDERWTAVQLLKHEFLQGEFDQGGKNGLDAKPVNVDAEKAEEREEDAAPLLAFTPQWNRLENEFDVLKFLGRGGFGDVLKVRNKLDGCVYAIKRIILNPCKKEENRKITREVKLLSRLNHENVVRYYNSWIERGVEEANSSSNGFSTTTDDAPKQDLKRKSSLQQKNVFFNAQAADSDEIEKNAPPPRNDSVEWSVSGVQSKDFGKENDSSSDEDDSSDDVVFGNLFFDNGDVERRRTTLSDDDDDVMFERGTDESSIKLRKKEVELESSESSSKSPKTTVDAVKSEMEQNEPPGFVQILYIQMEYCEKATLRQVIDDGEIFADHSRAWRLFREIVEGLAYIHKQNMIHRDLKPVNIFLDSNDYAKIGDFGLATRGFLSQAAADASGIADVYTSAGFVDSVNSLEQVNELTTKIGTALYIAPELVSSSSSKKPYTQHVDIYSLGIILFEMFYRPLGTGMERVKILTDLRRADVVLPSDFTSDEKYKRQVDLVRRLVSHDVERRPDAEQLLRGDFLPPLEMQQNDFQLAVDRTLSDTQTRQYKWLVNAIMNQQPSTVQDYVYDNDMYKGSFAIKDSLLRKVVADKLTRLFATHAMVDVRTPLLLPKNKMLSENVDGRVDLMDKSGIIVHLPHDLRVPFARYVVRNNIVHLKRYAMGTVYRSAKISESHPRELTECALDFVTSPNFCLTSIAELLLIIDDVIYEFQALKERNYVIKINHTSFIKAALLNCGVDDERTQLKVRKVLADFYTRKIGKQKRKEILTSKLQLSEKVVGQLFDVLDVEEASLAKVSSALRPLTKRKGAAASMFKEALHDLDVVKSNCETFNVRLPLVVALTLSFSVFEYEGIVFQVVCDLKSKKQTKTDVFAVGGRYDALIEKFRKPASSVHLTASPAAVGASFAFDTILGVVAPPSQCQYDVLLCSVGKLMLKEKLSLAQNLWKSGLKADYLQEPVANLEELQDFCRKSDVAYLVVFKDSESGFVKIKSFDVDRPLDRKFAISDVSLFLQEKIGGNETPEMSAASTMSVKAHGDVASAVISGERASVFSGAATATFSNVKVHYITAERLQANTRRRYDAQMAAAVGGAIRRFSNKILIDVIISDVSGAAIKQVAAHVEFDDEKSFKDSLKEVFGKFNKYKYQLSLMSDEMWKLKFEQESASANVLILYSYVDEIYRVLL